MIEAQAYPFIWIWCPIALAMCFCLIGLKKTGFALLYLTLTVSFFTGQLEISALINGSAGLLLAAWLPSQTGKSAFFGHGLLIVWSILLAAHVAPGFNNLLVLDDVRSGPGSSLFSMYLNLDKPLVFFALLLAYPQLMGPGRLIDLRPLVVAIFLLIGLFFIAVQMKALHAEFSLPSWIWLFAVSNLLFTSLPEEAFFRGYLQQGASKMSQPYLGLILSSVLFGTAHFSGGFVLIVFATVAGLSYGLVFHFSGRLWASTITHFGFNLCHLLLFTYPLAER